MPSQPPVRDSLMISAVQSETCSKAAGKPLNTTRPCWVRSGPVDFTQGGLTGSAASVVSSIAVPCRQLGGLGRRTRPGNGNVSWRTPFDNAILYSANLGQRTRGPGRCFARRMLTDDSLMPLLNDYPSTLHAASPTLLRKRQSQRRRKFTFADAKSMTHCKRMRGVRRSRLWRKRWRRWKAPAGS